MIWLVVAILVAQVLDILSTNYTLAHGFIEINPIMKKCQELFGKLWFIPKLSISMAVMALGYALRAGNPTLATLVLGIAFVGSSYPPIANTYHWLTRKK